MVKRLALDDYHELLDRLTEIISSLPLAVIDAESIARTEEFRKTLVHLEGLLGRMFLHCVPISYSGVLHRAILAKYQKIPLSCEGSLNGNGRFHLKGQHTLYFAEDIETITVEINKSQFSNYQHIIYPASVNLTKICDFSDNTHKEILDVFIDYMRKEWAIYLDIWKVKPVTHIVSDVLRNHGYEGLKFESRLDGKYNLAVFPKNIGNGSFINIKDPQPDQSMTMLNFDNLNLFIT